MKILILGALGQLGWELQRTAPEKIDIIPLDYQDVDISDKNATIRMIAGYSPDWIINAAAYTAVDKAEEEKKDAFAVNEKGAANTAIAAMETGARLIHISTDFVFDGIKSAPYTPDDNTAPLSVYGLSKLMGERCVLDIAGKNAIIIRTSWLYSIHGNNFVKSMIRLMSNKTEISIVADQVGTPTWARGLAEAIWNFMKKQEIHGIFHWSDSGIASWYDFAVAIKEESMAIGLLKNNIAIKPIGTIDYPVLAKRPCYSVLDKSLTWNTLGYYALHWRESLRKMLRELKENSDA